MKKIEILCVGKIKEPYFAAAIAEYQKRLSRFCTFSVIEIQDSADSAEPVVKESNALSQKIDGYTILLDRLGESVTSEGFSKAIDTAFTRGAEKIQVIIGGSRGVDERLKSVADKSFSFGGITYPHQLMRVIAAEQIYRAMCIQNGLPYHK